jgi:hypothetical protein
MNADILRKLGNFNGTDWGDASVVGPEDVGGEMACWLAKYWDDFEPITPAGKNFASFDRQFLKRLPDFEQNVRLHHRTLDPAMLFWRPGDEKLPDSKTCYQRAGKQGDVAHTALEDGLDVVWLIRAGIKRLK